MPSELKPCRDRLIELIRNGILKEDKTKGFLEIIADNLLANGAVVLDTGVISPKNRPLITHFADMPINDVIDLVRAKREGRIIVPPCKVGDKIYMLVTRKTHSFEFEEGKRMLRVDNQHTFIKQTYLTKLNFFKVLDDFGKTVFLTKEEAEKALKERDDNG